MKLRLVRHLWGLDQSQGYEQYLKDWREIGYEGIEASIRHVQHKAAFLSFLRKEKIGWVPQLFSNLFKGGGTVRDHLKSLKEQAEPCFEYQPWFFNAQSGSDAWSLTEAVDFYGECLELERKWNIPLCHETHRGRYFNTPWNCCAILNKYPTLKLTCDFSHWVCVCERLLEDCFPMIEQAAQAAYHIHSRVGHEQGPQVGDPRAMEYARHLAAHEKWWDLIWQSQQARQQKETYLTPEFGPPPYQPGHPFSQLPVSSLEEICDWMALRQVERFKKQFTVQLP